MLQVIRNLNFGWIVIMIGLVEILAGYHMQIVDSTGKTLLCFDKGCIVVQGITLMVTGVFFCFFGLYMILKKLKEKSN